MSAIKAEIVVVGGGRAGLSAALTLARARRRVIVIDSDEPRNAPALGAHGLFGHEGINPTRHPDQRIRRRRDTGGEKHQHRAGFPGRRPRRDRDGDQPMSLTTPIRVDVWSDLQCIWCYISSARLRTAVDRHLGPVEVVYHSFQLSPDAPVDIDRDAHIRSHNMDRARMQQIKTQLAQLIAGEGLPLRSRQHTADQLPPVS